MVSSIANMHVDYSITALLHLVKEREGKFVFCSNYGSLIAWSYDQRL